MRTIQGNLISLAQAGHFDVIAHGCNCYCTMGAGIAKAIRSAFPAAWAADQQTARGDRSKLGSCSFAETIADGRSLTVVNAYTQYDYRGSGLKLDYDALASSMRWIKARFAGSRIGLPQIGAGLAGGDWSRISQIIAEALINESVTIVQFKP